MRKGGGGWQARAGHALRYPSTVPRVERGPPQHTPHSTRHHPLQGARYFPSHFPTVAAHSPRLVEQLVPRCGAVANRTASKEGVQERAAELAVSHLHQPPSTPTPTTVSHSPSHRCIRLGACAYPRHGQRAHYLDMRRNPIAAWTEVWQSLIARIFRLYSRRNEIP